MKFVTNSAENQSMPGRVVWVVYFISLCVAAFAGYFAGEVRNQSSDLLLALETYKRYFSFLRAMNENPAVGGFDGGGINYYFYEEFSSLTSLGSGALPTLRNIIVSDPSDNVSVHAVIAIESIEWNDNPKGVSDAEIRTKVLDWLNDKKIRSDNPET
jgi:hypothetical protein